MALLTEGDKIAAGLVIMILLLVLLLILMVTINNDSNNELYKQAIERGCSIINGEILCPGVAR